jgi:hypothetical protein
VGIGAGACQRHAFQQAQGGGGRQPVVARHPAIDAEQPKGQAAAVEADADQMGEGPIRAAAAEQMQVAMLAIAPVAVVIALGAAGGIAQIRRRIVLLLDQGGAAGEGTHQRAVALGEAQPVLQGPAGRSAAPDRHRRLQREGPQPPSWAPQPPLCCWFPAGACPLAGGVVGAFLPADEPLPRGVGLVAAPAFWASRNSRSAPASAAGTVRAAAESTAVARPWRRRSARRAGG